MVNQLLSAFGNKMFIINPYRFGGVFSPPDIAGLALWMDGSDITTMWQDSGKTTAVASDGDPVGNWVDKSTNAHEMIQTAALDKPLYKTGVQNSKSALLSDSSDFLFKTSSVLASTLNLSVFFVAKTSADNHVGGIYTSSNSSTSQTAVFVDSGSFGNIVAQIDTAADAVVNLSLSADIGTEAIQCSFIRDGSSLEIWKSGVSQDTGTVTASSETTNDYTRLFAQRGALNNLEGHLMELIIYEASLSTSDRQSVETYLINKWGI